MSTPVQPHPSWKRKYSTLNTQIDDSMGAQTSRQARHRASMLAKRNAAISSDISLHAPLPACTSNQQSQTPINSSSYLHSGDCKHTLPYVNKLRDHRSRGQNSVVFDGQDRLAKVAAFVSTLLDNIKKPILIIASSSTRLLWEMEFSKWSKSINVVTYRGTKDIRAAIRGSKFQVLLSSLDAIVEDMETLEHIKWNLLVIDECQCPVISTHLKKIQMLMADMKLLTVSGEPVSYRNILSLVDCKSEKIHTDADMEMNEDISILKERLSPFIAFECDLEGTQKETSAAKILQIPASALIPPNSLAGSGLRLPAPHLRSSPSMFAPFRNRPANGEPSLEQLPSVNYPNSDTTLP